MNVSVKQYLGSVGILVMKDILQSDTSKKKKKKMTPAVPIRAQR